MTVDDLIIESLLAKERFWFIKAFEVIEHTESTVTLHFTIAGVGHLFSRSLQRIKK